MKNSGSDEITESFLVVLTPLPFLACGFQLFSCLAFSDFNLMTIIRWILAVLFALCALLQVAGGNLVGFILFAIACALVLPLLDSAIESGLAFLKSGVLRIFLSVVLAVFGLAAGAGSVVSIADVNICTAEAGQACTADKPFFLPGDNPVTITAIASEGDAESIEDVVVEAFYVATPDTEPQPVFNEVITPEIDGDNLTVSLSGIPLQVGSYEVNLRPVAGEEETAVGKDVVFTVWPSQETLDKRLSSDIGSSDFEDSISDNFICIYDGEIPDGEELVTEESRLDLSYCDETQDLPAGTTPFIIDYGFPDSVESGTNITYTLRYLPTEEEGDEPFEIFTDVVTLDAGLDRFGNVGELTEDFLPGNYDLLSVINIPESKPVKLEFTITE